MGHLSSAAKKACIGIKLFDIAATKKNYHDSLIEIRNDNPEILAFSAHAIQTFQDVLQWSNRLKQDLKLPTLVGGYEAKIYPLECLLLDVLTPVYFTVWPTLALMQERLSRL